MLEFIFGRSRLMAEIRRYVERISCTDLPVFIQGETGTGKSLLAKQIHSLSHKRDGRFCTLDCAAIPASLVDSELFGFEKGAFTGAHEGKIGIIETANGGTIFLDEIENLELFIQAKLLTVLEDRRIRRIGARKEIELDFKLISASNDHILDRMRKGTFRQDLFYRLRGTEIFIPPLRERCEDIPLLANHFLGEYNKRYHSKKTFARDVQACLSGYFWPGNVRELKNAVEVAALRAEAQEIGIEDFAFDLDPGDLGMSNWQSPLSLNDIEKRHIEKVLQSVDFNKTRAARILGIGLNTLYRKIEKYEIRRKC